MNKALILFIFVVACGTFAHADDNENAEEKLWKEWQACQTNDECDTIQGPCGRPISVNRTFTRTAEAFVAEMIPRIECAPQYGLEDENTAAACIENKCAVQPTPRV